MGFQIVRAGLNFSKVIVMEHAATVSVPVHYPVTLPFDGKYWEMSIMDGTSSMRPITHREARCSCTIETDEWGAEQFERQQFDRILHLFDYVLDRRVEILGLSHAA